MVAYEEVDRSGGTGAQAEGQQGGGGADQGDAGNGGDLLMSRRPSVPEA